MLSGNFVIVGQNADNQASDNPITGISYLLPLNGSSVGHFDSFVKFFRYYFFDCYFSIVQQVERIFQVGTY